MASKVTISAKISARLSAEIVEAARRERRTLDYVVKEGLKLFLIRQENEDREDYELGIAAWNEHVAEGKPVHTYEDVFGKLET